MLKYHLIFCFKFVQLVSSEQVQKLVMLVQQEHGVQRAQLRVTMIIVTVSFEVFHKLNFMRAQKK